ncbi:ATP-binding protein [Nocardioides zeae]|uniref:ATP-binding protein n=1 Tax=Nocardioides imazamoxiresistens TaxID=3231893 RepID=A0ABU3PRV5_9ACTN|nr:ATP-binding protein [Nocardioides zeae]MDT9591965.1 ATP-binding protein [Nocardioides zeae]
MSLQERPAPAGTPHTPRTLDVSVPFADASANVARRELIEFLEPFDVPRRAVEDASTVLYELVRNGVDHGRPCADHDLEVTWTVDTETLTLRVTDCGTADGTCPPACRHGADHRHGVDGSDGTGDAGCRLERWRLKLLEPPQLDSMRGRGLHLVDALSASWDVTTTQRGTTVEAVVELAG